MLEQEDQLLRASGVIQRSIAPAWCPLQEQRTHREKSMADMERVVSRACPIAVIEPLYDSRVGHCAATP